LLQFNFPCVMLVIQKYVLLLKFRETVKQKLGQNVFSWLFFCFIFVSVQLSWVKTIGSIHNYVLSMTL
jgi:hypothetical protein